MQITKNDIDELNAEIRITIGPDDYQEKVDTILRDHRKKASMPGFRPGKVPMGMIRKMYGNSVLADELNKLLSDNLYKYITENNLEVLGNPMPKEEDKVDIGGEAKEYEFAYDLGLAPSFEVSISDKDKFNLYNIKVDDELVEKYVKDIAKQNGNVSDIEESGSEDLVHGEFIEVDGKGNPVDGGIRNESTISIEFVEDKSSKNALTGLKKEDKVTIDPKKVNKTDAETAKMLGIEPEQVDGLKNKFEMRVINIHQMDPAPLNQELFDKVFGPGQVTTEEDFRKRIEADLKTMFERDSNRKLKRDVQDKLIEKLDLSLPHDFLRKWLLQSNDGLTEEQIDKDYDNYTKDLRWRLIENKIVSNNEIKIEEEEILGQARESIKRQFAAYGSAGMDESFFNDFAQKMVAKEDERRKIVDQLLDEKLLTLFKDTFKLTDKEVSFDEFVNLVTGKPAKNKFMDNLNNLLKF